MKCYLTVNQLFLNLIVLIALLTLPSKAVQAEAFQLGSSGSVELEVDAYGADPLHVGQKQNSSTMAFSPRWKVNWQTQNNIEAELTLAPFFQVATYDDNRTYADLREAKLRYSFGQTDFTIGYGHIFWGKTESDQLVDVINQKDFSAASNSSDKLGQPMLMLSHFNDFDSASLVTTAYYLPQFRERNFVGIESRGRSALPIDTDAPIYLDNTTNDTPSYALRFDLAAGSIDLGFSFFNGMSRDPGFALTSDNNALNPIYSEITQLGLDGQITLDSTLLKFEAIKRNGQINRLGNKENYTAAILGAEYTFHRLGNSNADLGLIFEYAKDNRDNRALTPLENDIVLGARLALNNTQDSSALLTTSVDKDNGEIYLRFEGNHRLNDMFSVYAEAGVLLDSDPDSLLYDQRDDSFLSMALSYSW